MTSTNIELAENLTFAPFKLTTASQNNILPAGLPNDLA
jgi:hypothetical protein